MAQMDKKHYPKTPVVKEDGSLGYDQVVDNYFDVATFEKELASKSTKPSPTSLYDAIAQAHDSRHHLKAEMFNGENPIDWEKRRNKQTRGKAGLEKRTPFAGVYVDSAEYLGIGWEHSGWRPRRNSVEDRRGAFVVNSDEYNDLVPYVPPVDVHMDDFPRKATPQKRTPHIDLMTAVLENYPFLHASDGDDELDSSSISDSGSRDSFSIPPASPSPPPRPLPELSATAQTSLPAPSTAISESESESEDALDTDTESDAESDCSCCNNPDGVPCPRFWANIPKFLLPASRRTPSIDSAADLESYGNMTVGRRDSSFGIGPSPLSQVTTSSSSNDGSQANHVPKRMVTKRKLKTTAAPKRAAKKPRKAPVAVLASPPFSASSQSSVSPDTETSSSSCASPASSAHDHEFIYESPGEVAKQNSFPCLLDGCTQVCASAGDLMRHQQSLRHKPPSHPCLACRRAFTRPDALKRHLNGKSACKRAHQTALAQGGPSETN